MPTPRFSPRDKRLARNGGAIVLAAAAVAGILHKWEDGGKAFPKDGYVVYADKLARGLPTTCHGMTKHVTDVPIVVGERWSKEKCDRIYGEVIAKVQMTLISCFTLTPPQSVFDMATSHAWNNGAPNTCSSGAMGAWNRGEWAHGCRLMSMSDEGKPVWSSVRTGKILPNGKPEFKFVQGLHNRRQDETAQCLKDVT